MQPNRTVFSSRRIAVLHPEGLSSRIGSRIRGTEDKRREEEGNTAFSVRSPNAPCVATATRRSAQGWCAMCDARRDATRRDATRPARPRSSSTSATPCVGDVPRSVFRPSVRLSLRPFFSLCNAPRLPARDLGSRSRGKRKGAADPVAIPPLRWFLSLRDLDLAWQDYRRRGIGKVISRTLRAFVSAVDTSRLAGVSRVCSIDERFFIAVIRYCVRSEHPIKISVPTEYLSSIPSGAAIFRRAERNRGSSLRFFTLAFGNGSIFRISSSSTSRGSCMNALLSE